MQLKGAGSYLPRGRTTVDRRLAWICTILQSPACKLLGAVHIFPRSWPLEEDVFRFALRIFPASRPSILAARGVTLFKGLEWISASPTLPPVCVVLLAADATVGLCEGLSQRAPWLACCSHVRVLHCSFRVI